MRRPCPSPCLDRGVSSPRHVKCCLRSRRSGHLSVVSGASLRGSDRSTEHPRVKHSRGTRQQLSRSRRSRCLYGCPTMSRSGFECFVAAVPPASPAAAAKRRRDVPPNKPDTFRKGVLCPLMVQFGSVQFSLGRFGSFRFASSRFGSSRFVSSCD